MQGAGSCAAASCHGGQAPQGHWRSAYVTWITHDPHAKAYQVLFGDQSRRIMENLGRRNAHRDSQCLNCHVHPDWERTAHAERFAIADGVSCESCHGPAEKWLARHHAADWPLLSSAEKRALGWRDTKDLVERARACTACHVGTGGSDVNHDLIAAGHPPLKFEFSAYHAALPRHWDERKDRALHPDLEARVWQIGQVVSAQAVLELLAHRAAAAAERQRPWPEFAEYNCVACHHSLKADGSRPRADGRRPGTLPWSTWYLPLPGADSHLSGFAKLQQAMEKPLPLPAAVEAQANLLRQNLEPLLARACAERPLEPRHLRDRFNVLLAKHGQRASANWDDAAQLYQALVAHCDAWRASEVRFADDPKRLHVLGELAKTLTIPPGEGSPRGFRPERVRDLFKLLDALGRKP